MDIKEINTIRTLLNDGQVVVAAGGGGIPVVKEADGSLSGVEAVIDKDFASQRLAELVEADLFIVLTGVDYVFVNYNKPDQSKNWNMLMWLNWKNISNKTNLHQEACFLK